MKQKKKHPKTSNSKKESFVEKVCLQIAIKLVLHIIKVYVYPLVKSFLDL